MRTAAQRATPTPGSVKPLNTRQLAKAATRGKVLAASKSLFGMIGYEAATIRGIAKLSNMSTGAVFGHFSGKAELWQAVYGEPPIPPEKARVLLAALTTLTDQCEAEFTLDGRWVDNGQLVSRAAYRAARAAIALATTVQTEAA